MSKNIKIINIITICILIFSLVQLYFGNIESKDFTTTQSLNGLVNLLAKKYFSLNPKVN